MNAVDRRRAADAAASREALRGGPRRRRGPPSLRASVRDGGTLRRSRASRCGRRDVALVVETSGSTDARSAWSLPPTRCGRARCDGRRARRRAVAARAAGAPTSRGCRCSCGRSSRAPSPRAERLVHAGAFAAAALGSTTRTRCRPSPRSCRCSSPGSSMPPSTTPRSPRRCARSTDPARRSGARRR